MNCSINGNKEVSQQAALCVMSENKIAIIFPHQNQSSFVVCFFIELLLVINCILGIVSCFASHVCEKSSFELFDKISCMGIRLEKYSSVNYQLVFHSETQTLKFEVGLEKFI